MGVAWFEPQTLPGRSVDLAAATPASPGATPRPDPGKEATAPCLTIFIGGNHEAVNHLWELYYGGWVAPNIYFLGFSGCVRVGGLRIAGLSGIHNARDHPLVLRSSEFLGLRCGGFWGCQRVHMALSSQNLADRGNQLYLTHLSFSCVSGRRGARITI